MKKENKLKAFIVSLVFPLLFLICINVPSFIYSMYFAIVHATEVNEMGVEQFTVMLAGYAPYFKIAGVVFGSGVYAICCAT